jgi:hypothetical protein
MTAPKKCRYCVHIETELLPDGRAIARCTKGHWDTPGGQHQWYSCATVLHNRQPVSGYAPSCTDYRAKWRLP